MPRMISFFLTTPQFIDGSKTVTRRMGWLHAKDGMELMAVEKAQGLGKGGKVNRLGLIHLLSVRRERLDLMIDNPAYGREEARREGFPDMSGRQFVEFYCDANRCLAEDEITRLEFFKLSSHERKET
jgi:hypothetical protein